MVRLLIFFAFAAALAGCYNPRYPDKGTDAETPYRSSAAEDQAARDRRDSAAGSGASRRY
ncbi:MAG TPA: hypothetical protein VJQ58_06320 [Burkholderiales bacterium]|nr:hypothetical protein [Burkholderiales bacterium]